MERTKKKIDMDYEKKYKEALERFKTFREKYCTYGELHFGDVIFDKTGEAQKDLDAIFPELRESEDERIRKEIIDYLGLVGKGKGDYAQPMIDRWIAHLEKLNDFQFDYPGLYFYDGKKLHFQGNPAMEENPYDFAMSQQEKQKEPIDPFDTKLFQDGVKEGRRLEREDIKKEPIPIPDKFSGLKSLMLQYLQSAANRKDDTEVESDTDLFGRKILDYVWKYSEKQKEQKPVHFELKAGKWYICHRAFCCRADHLTVKEGERFMCEKDGVVKGFVVKEPEKYFIECSAPAPMEDEQKEQKPADNQFPPLDGLDAIKAQYYDRGFKNGFDEGVDSVKPAEWSEEDENNLELVIDCIYKFYPDPVMKYKLKEWLKSRRPVKQEWSEEDEETLEKLHRLLVICRGEKKFIQEADYNKMDNLLKSLRPHWKPSEVCYGAKGDPDPAGVWKPSEEQPQVADASKMEQEVDLEKEIDKGIADYSFTKTIDSGGFKTTVIDYVKIARHFYELGLKARKEK